MTMQTAIAALEINSEADFSRAFEAMTMVRKQSVNLDEQRAEEKKPHFEAAKAVDTKWKAEIAPLDGAVAQLKGVLDGWLKDHGEPAQRPEGLRLTWKHEVTIVDHEAALLALFDNKDLRAALVPVVQKLVEAGMVIDGVISTKHRALC